MSTEKEISLKEMPAMIAKWLRFLLSKWLWILSIVLSGGIIGLTYAWLQKPIYTAEITFAPENEKGSSIGMYAGLAAQFGLDIGGGGGVFEGENLMEFLKSKMLIEKALLSPLDSNILIVERYIGEKKYRNNWNDNPNLKSLSFSEDQQPNRLRDSIMDLIIKDVSLNLIIEKKDKKLNIVSVKMTNTDEVFAKSFVERLVEKGIQYYVDYRSKKTRENVQILQRQADSVRRTMQGDIVSVAASTDLNVNPVRQIVRTGVQKKQIDVQVNSQVYGELLKQLELSKISLRKETPLVEVIDTPRYPLPKKKMGRLMGGLLFGILGGILAVVIFTVQLMFKSPAQQFKN